MKNNNKGFSLVELIVVIAIMAILAAVAVVGFSMYIPKAQQASDKQLVSDVEYALTLQYYNNPEGAAGAYVVLTPNGASASNAFAAEAMANSFGAAWEDELKLAYDKWTDDGLLNLIAGYTEADLSLIANSTFLDTASTESMMQALTQLTGVTSDVISGYEGDVEGKLNTLLGPEFVEKLNGTGVTSEDDEYEAVISNLLVGHFANSMNNSSMEEVEGDALGSLALTYTTLYAYSATVENGDDMMNQINDYLRGQTEMDNVTDQEKLLAFILETDEDFAMGYDAYYQGEGQTDKQATLEIMGAVSHITDTYTDVDDLSKSDLFTSASVSEQMNNYVNAVKALSGMTEEQRQALGDVEAGSIVIFVAEDGTVTVTPQAAWHRS